MAHLVTQLTLFDHAAPPDPPAPVDLLPQTDALLPTHYLGFLDPDEARTAAMRLIMTGRSGSGKTTALHHLLGHGLRRPWSEVLILDGKQSSLEQYAPLPGVTYLGPWQVARWTQHLKRLADSLGHRFERQQQGLDPGRWLIVVDEVQRGTRAKGVGKTIRDSLDLLAEQSDALGDVLIVTSQRELNAIPVSVRENCHAHLIMLAGGYYYLKHVAQPAHAGRAGFVGPETALLRAALPPDPPFCRPYLPQLLDTLDLIEARPPVTLYLGAPGLGKTYALQRQPNRPHRRRLYLDLSQPGRDVLLEIIEKAGVLIPDTLRVNELTTLAALALQSQPTLLLLDNVEQAEPRLITALGTLIAACDRVVLAANRPKTESQREKLESLYPRCEVVHLRRLTHDEGRRLLWSVLDRPQVPNPGRVEHKILVEAGGNPAYIVSLAKRVQFGDQAELQRLYLHQMFRVNLRWLGLLLVIGILMASRRYVDSFVLMTIVSIGYLVLRRRLYRR